MNSAIYEGLVRHRRFSPVPHSVTYRLFIMYLDLDEQSTVFADRWLWSVDQRNLAHSNARTISVIRRFLWINRFDNS